MMVSSYQKDFDHCHACMHDNSNNKHTGKINIQCV